VIVISKAIVNYLRRQTRPQQIMIKQIASPVKPTATTAATTKSTQITYRSDEARPNLLIFVRIYTY